jgi:hypothetical protein
MARVNVGLVRMSRLLTAFVGAALVAGLLPEQTAAQPADTLKALLAARSCLLSGELQAVYERPSPFKERDRFLVLSVKASPQSYVQCMFADNRSKLYCEASSFYYAEPAGKPRMLYLPPEVMAALEKLGFATGTSQKNFPYERPLNGTPDFDAIATLMLTALHDAYGVREETELKTFAPFAGNPVVACRR